MSEAVIVALIAGGVSLLGSILSGARSEKLTAYKLDELKEDFGRLEARVNKHNSFIERLTVVEESTKAAHKRLDEIKGGRK